MKKLRLSSKKTVKRSIVNYTKMLYPKSVIRISLCRTAKRNPNDRFGFNGFSCVENASVKIGV